MIYSPLKLHLPSLTRAALVSLALSPIGLSALPASAAANTTAAKVQSTAVDGWNFNLPAEDLASLCIDTLTNAKKAFSAIENDTSEATLESVFGAYDAMSIDLQAMRHVWYLKSVHPNQDIRAAAEVCVQEYTDFASGLDLSRKFYERVSAIDLTDLSAPEARMVKNQLRDFRQSGVDRDEATRERVRQVKREITEIGNTFDRTIREDTRYVATTPAGLEGLPQDFIDSHPADENGEIQISTNYPDVFPVLKYSTDDNLRKQLHIARNNIGSPANTDNLKQLVTKRYELAQLLGYDSYAALAMDGLMIGSPDNAKRFLNEVGTALKAPASRDMGILLTRLQEIDPSATQVQAWQGSYLSNLVRQEDYALDSQEVREYFHFDKVQSGIFALTQDLFDVEIVPWQTDTWHESVTTWEIQRNGTPLGRFYLDMHPREDKYKHAAHWTLRTGLKDKQLPLSGLATNFPEGLMEHNQVETYLHEFGHLIHNMFSGTQSWMSIGGMSMERDFVEAPSQMLEEWVWDYDTLSQFATNSEGEVIPRELVNKMRSARYFATASSTASQIFFANISLSFYMTPPEQFEPLPLLKSLQAKYSPYPYVEGTYFYNNFGHLNGYSSNYYIYQWSLAIATDMFSRFEKEGLRNTSVSYAYRDEVLGAAGSKPAADFVGEFLERPFSTDAYIRFLNSLN
ncbi:MAG: M3 family metallopeptidase [Halioglobus sp.]